MLSPLRVLGARFRAVHSMQLALPPSLPGEVLAVVQEKGEPSRALPRDAFARIRIPYSRMIDSRPSTKPDPTEVGYSIRSCPPSAGRQKRLENGRGALIALIQSDGDGSHSPFEIMTNPALRRRPRNRSHDCGIILARFLFLYQPFRRASLAQGPEPVEGHLSREARWFRHSSPRKHAPRFLFTPCLCQRHVGFALITLIHLDSSSEPSMRGAVSTGSRFDKPFRQAQGPEPAEGKAPSLSRVGGGPGKGRPLRSPVSRDRP
jgi:hypothetical protein